MENGKSRINVISKIYFGRVSCEWQYLGPAALEAISAHGWPGPERK
jgi:hypothetical protein